MTGEMWSHAHTIMYPAQGQAPFVVCRQGQCEQADSNSLLSVACYKDYPHNRCRLTHLVPFAQSVSKS